MRKPLLALTLVLSASLHAQTASETNLGSKLTVDSSTTPATYTFSWWGKSNFHYIVETTPDLATWSFLPDFNPTGTDAVIGIQFTTDASKYFFRAIQFDPSDISSLADTDGDGLPDKWELYYFGNLDRDGSGDFDEDGLSDRFEYQGGGSPILAPDSSTVGVLNFTYDLLGRVETVTAPFSMSFNFDDEGNLNAVQ